MERAGSAAKASSQECQPIADLYSTDPVATRSARTGQEVYDFRSGREDWYHIYLDAYGSTEKAQKALAALQTATQDCTGFSIAGGWEFSTVREELPPEVGDKALAFRADHTMYNVIRLGTVLAVFEGNDVSSSPGEGVVSPTLVEAQIKKLRRAESRN